MEGASSRSHKPTRSIPAEIATRAFICDGWEDGPLLLPGGCRHVLSCVPHRPIANSIPAGRLAWLEGVVVDKPRVLVPATPTGKVRADRKGWVAITDAN